MKATVTLTSSVICTARACSQKLRREAVQKHQFAFVCIYLHLFNPWSSFVCFLVPGRYSSENIQNYYPEKNLAHKRANEMVKEAEKYKFSHVPRKRKWDGWAGTESVSVKTAKSFSLTSKHFLDYSVQALILKINISNNSYCLLSTYYVSGSVVTTQHAFIYQTLTLIDQIL